MVLLVRRSLRARHYHSTLIRFAKCMLRRTRFAFVIHQNKTFISLRKYNSSLHIPIVIIIIINISAQKKCAFFMSAEPHIAELLFFFWFVDKIANRSWQLDIKLFSFSFIQFTISFFFAIYQNYAPFRHDRYAVVV